MTIGWVAYSISSLVAALGSNKLMPLNSDCKCMVINGISGYSRDNSSWVIGRMVRDIDHWAGEKTRARVEKNIADRWQRSKVKNPNASKPTRAGLVVSVYEPSKTLEAGVQQRDWLYWSGVSTMVLQLGLAAIPLGVHGDWSVLMLTVAGTLLALITGSLSQWRREKWACRRFSETPYILTEGNGAQHVILVLGNGHGLNLEDLATGQTGKENDKENKAWLYLSGLAIPWIILLITATGIEDHTWYLVGMGSLGIVQNVVVAGAVREPRAQGIPLDPVAVYGDASVMQTLYMVEDKYPGIGRRLRDEFFQGRLRDDEVAKWDALKERELSDSAPN